MKIVTGFVVLFLLAGFGIQAQELAEFRTLVKTWTTKPEFLSPLVDHLPLKSGVPTPREVLGYFIGEPKKLTYTADQQRFFRQLEKALPERVRTMTIGKVKKGGTF